MTLIKSTTSPLDRTRPGPSESAQFSSAEPGHWTGNARCDWKGLCGKDCGYSSRRACDIPMGPTEARTFFVDSAGI